MDRYQILEEREYNGRMGDESQKWIDAPSIEEAFAIYTQRHGEPFEKYITSRQSLATLKYQVENGNNPYVLRLTIYRLGAFGEEVPVLQPIEGYGIYVTTSEVEGVKRTVQLYAKSEEEARLKHKLHFDLFLWVGVEAEEV